MEHAFLSRPEPRITGNPKRGPGRPWELVAQSLVNPDIDDGMALGGSNPISTSQHVRVSIPRRYCRVSVVCLIEFHLTLYIRTSVPYQGPQRGCWFHGGCG